MPWRIWRETNKYHNAFILVLSFIAVASLFMSITSVKWYIDEENAKEDDQFQQDLAACARGNEFRREVKIIANAARDLDKDILNTLFGLSDNPDRVRQIDALLAPSFVRFNVAVAQLEEVDCEAVIDG